MWRLQKLLKCPPSALRDAVYIVFDTETTTLQWQTGCIIQLAGRLYQPGEDTVEVSAQRPHTLRV